MSNAYRRANRRLPKGKYKADPAVPATEATAKQNVEDMPSRKGAGKTKSQTRMEKVGKELAAICSRRREVLAEASASSRVPKDQECWVDRNGRAQFRLKAEIQDALKALDGDLVELGNELFPQVPDRTPQHSPLETQGENDDQGFKEISDAMEEINQHADEVVDELKAHKERWKKVNIRDFTDEECKVFDRESRCGHNNSPGMVALIKAVYLRKYFPAEGEQPAVPPKMTEAIRAARQDANAEYYSLVNPLVRSDFTEDEWKLYLKLKINAPEMLVLLRGVRERKTARKDALTVQGTTRITKSAGTSAQKTPCVTCKHKNVFLGHQPCRSCVSFNKWTAIHPDDREPA